MKTPIYYIVEDGVSIKDVQRLNINSLKWTLIDFVNSYVTLAANGDKRYEDYMDLKEFSVEKGISISLSCMLLSGASSNAGFGLFGKIKEGLFKITTRKEAEKITYIVSKISPLLGPSVYGHRELVLSIRKLMKIYSSDEIISAIKSSGKMIKKEFNTQNYLTQISENTKGKLKIEQE